MLWWEVWGLSKLRTSGNNGNTNDDYAGSKTNTSSTILMGFKIAVVRFLSS
jgi:hypothetical protein